MGRDTGKKEDPNQSFRLHDTVVFMQLGLQTAKLYGSVG